jgi:proteasome regulatory subunit
MHPKPDGKRGEKNSKDGEYLVNYLQHLEKRLRDLETERQLIDSERLRLEQEVRNLRSEIDRLREPPLITGTVTDILGENDKRVVVKSSSGPSFIVNLTRKLRNEQILPGMSVALNQRTFSIMEILPTKLDPFVQGMELLDHIPDESYEQIGGLEEQIQEVRETVELPLKRPDLFKKLGIEPPKGVLLHGLPGTGKTLLAKAVAHETKATFIRVIGSELIQKYIGEGARFVREIFNLARQRAPTILFIDELDAVGATRLFEATSGDREVQRTLMQLLSELDGFHERGDVKLIGATNRIDILDPALLRPGRFDRIIEFPIPDKKARKEIFKIYMDKLNIDGSIKLKEIIDLTEKTTGADIKSITTEAGMFAIRRNSEIITQEDFIAAISKIMKKVQEPHKESKMII